MPSQWLKKPSNFHVQAESAQIESLASAVFRNKPALRGMSKVCPKLALFSESVFSLVFTMLSERCVP